MKSLLFMAVLLFPALVCLGQTNAVDPEAAARLAQLGSRRVRAHDPSTIVRCKDEFWTFHTGRGTPSYRSKDLLTWTAGPRVFTNAPAWVRETVPNNRGGMDFWAPDVLELNGRFLLYYSVSSFGRNTSAIGLAVNKTLDPDDLAFEWKDEGIVVRSFATNNFNAIDPAVILDHERRLWLSFGSFWDGIQLVELNPATGKRLNEEIRTLARHEAIEAPFIYRREKFYYLFVNWGRCCRGTNSTYNIRMGRSEKITGPYLDKEGKDLAAGGGSLFLETEGPFIGPGHAGIVADRGQFWLSLHFYDGTQRGMSMLAVRPLMWGEDGWPMAGRNE